MVLTTETILIRVIPRHGDDIGTRPPMIAPERVRAIREEKRLLGPGPILDGLSDDELDALHEWREVLAAGQGRHLSRTATSDDFPFDIAETTHVLGVTAGTGAADDPTDFDIDSLPEIASDAISDLCRAWTTYAESESL